MKIHQNEKIVGRIESALSVKGGRGKGAQCQFFRPLLEEEAQHKDEFGDLAQLPKFTVENMQQPHQTKFEVDTELM